MTKLTKKIIICVRNKQQPPGYRVLEQAVF